MKKTVLMVSNFLPPGMWSYGVCQALAKRLAESGWGVITTSSQVNRFLRLLDMLVTIVKQRRRYQVAQVDVFSRRAFLWAELSSLLLRWLGKPFVLTLHGGHLPEFARRHPARVRWLLRRADVVTAPSEFLKTALRGFRPDIVVLPNPVDIPSYIFKLREAPRPNLVWLRAFHQVYNPEMAVRVVSELRETYPQVHLSMVGVDKGDGSFQETVRLAETLGLKDHVEFVPGVPKEEVPAWLNRGDIFLNTTNFDNTPVSVIEAMACGLCVVSTDVGGLPYLLDPEQDALLVSPNNAGLMDAAVRQLLADPGLAAYISRNARKKAEQFDWPAILSEWEKIFNSLA